MERHLARLATLGLLAMVTIGPRAYAKGGSALSVTTTAAVSGTLVSGTIAIANASSTTVAVSSLTNALEVRYPTGVVPPGLPAGVTSGYYRVVSVTLPSPGSVPALATVTVPYTVDTCDPQVAAFRGAKDVRSVATVTAAGSTADGRSPNVAAPQQATCPVCGNGIREGREQCDGGACCTTACTVAADGSYCNDANACTRTDQCRSGSCVGTNPVVCIASDQCHYDGTCSPSTGLCSTPARANGSACDDGSACTTGDACGAGRCVGTSITCNDGNACTTDGCAAGTCVFVPNTAPCSDGDACTAGDLCADGACTGGASQSCDDHKTCTDDGCNAALGCTHVATSCDGCDAGECALCRDDCTAATSACSDACWAAFWSCLNGCTSTYCAPFCQVDLGRCIDACPSEPTCFDACDAGNGCGAACGQS